jgi:uncharacterized membrane protein
MSRNEFISELKKKLHRLPQSEVDSTVSYYEEYFNDAGPENEQIVLSELGTPSAVASKVIGEFAVDSAEKSRRPVSVWFIILAIFASPIALPVAIAVSAVVIAVIVVIFAVYLAIGISGLAIFANGLISIFAGIWSMAISVSTGLFYLGFGMIGTSVGAAIFMGMTHLTQITFRGIKKLLARFLIRRGSK